MKRKRSQPPLDASHLRPARSFNFSDLPYDMLTKIAASFHSPDLKSASSVCKSWREALRPLRAAMSLFMSGKRAKQGTDNIKPDLNKALDLFLKSLSLGSTLAMIDAGVLYSELGEKDEAIAMYTKAAELGDPAAQCNLGVSLLTDDPANPKEAVRWLHKASVAGCARAQYQLALCLQKGRGVQPNPSEAAKLHLRAATGGYVRAMYNTSLCYSYGEGFPRCHRHARMWMKLAANCGHSKAQYEHGLALYSSRDMLNAALFLELATRAGETVAANARDVILRKLSTPSRDFVGRRADSWEPLHV